MNVTSIVVKHRDDAFWIAVPKRRSRRRRRRRCTTTGAQLTVAARIIRRRRRRRTFKGADGARGTDGRRRTRRRWLHRRWRAPEPLPAAAVGGDARPRPRSAIGAARGRFAFCRRGSYLKKYLLAADDPAAAAAAAAAAASGSSAAPLLLYGRRCRCFCRCRCFRSYRRAAVRLPFSVARAPLTANTLERLYTRTIDFARCVYSFGEIEKTKKNTNPCCV